MAVRMRLLPVFVLAVFVVLGLKVEDLRRGVVMVAAAEEAGDEGTGSGPDEDTVVASAESAREASGTDGDLPDESESDYAVVGRDIIEFSDAELEVLQSLSARREALDRRADDLDTRESLLHLAERRLDERIAKLEELRAVIEMHLDTYETQEDERLRNLVRIYESMKPKEAARIFQDLEMDVLLDVVSRMRAQQSAKILAAMDPDRAKTVTTELIERKKLPNPAKTPGS